MHSFSIIFVLSRYHLRPLQGVGGGLGPGVKISTLGFDVGILLGLPVGILVGIFVGLFVGFFVGFVVGLKVLHTSS